ncbi:hypothetical protein HPP92_009939 [Vanilla planifolia]|uniref:Pentatricopeptide repeat-containing protein n=1 Tax=Vanilla planifolia TaxID=51239 RepID=A0A835V2Z7_VANPL|nr:hypothetical protein HPP92_009939 [Vanilla planifolia]
MITCYARHGNVIAARGLFDQMPERDIASWSAIICCYMHRCNPSQAFLLFREMIQAGKSKPDPMILVTILSGCAESGSLGLIGKSVHAYIERNHMDVNVQLGTSLIGMYGRCGCLKSAFTVFERMPERNVMHWTSMICGLAIHGYSEEALAFFERMLGTGVRPNKVTFTGVLNACKHAGMVEAGHNYFCSMKSDFGFDPEIYHYGCMVDLLANSGMLDDAYSMIQSMKVEPNVVIEKVLQIAEPDDDGGVYTLVSDLYALGGRWNDVQKVRVLMDRLVVRKKRGSSFIEVEDLRSSSCS